MKYVYTLLTLSVLDNIITIFLNNFNYGFKRKTGGKYINAPKFIKDKRN